jgi:excisionase family DNA binding protein
MATNYVSLDEAAKQLGISPDRLVEMRSQGQLRGFRDGASWKFPVDEIKRLQDSGLSGIGSDVGLGEEAGGSDVALIARQGGGSDVEVVASSRSDSGLEVVEDGGSGMLELAAEVKEGSTGPVIVGAEDLQSAEEGGTGPELSGLSQKGDSDVDVLGDLDLINEEKGGTGDIIRGDSDPDLALSDINSDDDALSDDDDLVIADDDDDLVLAGGGSDISIAGDSGINLMSPSDSGLSLESEPLDLAGSSISALDLGGDDSLSPAAGGSGSGSLVDFQADEEFQLSPSGVGLEADDDSGSQVIEVEDSSAFVGDVDFNDQSYGGGEVVAGEGMLDDSGLMAEDALVAEDALAGEEMGIQTGGRPGMGGAPIAYETPFTVWQVVVLASILVLMSLCGMLMTDLMRNLWTYSEPSAPVSSLTDALISMIGFDS